MNKKGSAKKGTWFYVTWGAILVIGDGLCWGTADYFWTHNLIVFGDFFFWMLWVVSLLSASRVILETWKRPKIVWLVSGACSLLIGIIIIFVSDRKPIPDTEPQPRPAPAPLPIEPFIEGTQTTYKRLSEAFPFGYAVFFYGQNKIIRNEIISNGLMDWKLDTDKVGIEPNFYTGMVTWTIPDVSITDSGPGGKIIMNGSSFTLSFPMRRGVSHLAGISNGNKPVMYVGTISDDQRRPVFVLGFRIPSQARDRRPDQH